MGPEHLSALGQDAVDPLRGDPREDPLVDQHRRPLVAHPQAVGAAQRELAVGRGLAKVDLQVIAKLAGHMFFPRHVAGRGAAEADDELALGPLVEKAVEGDHAVDFHGVEVQQIGNHLHAVLGNVEVLPLHFLEDGQQGAAIAADLADELEQFLAEVLAFGEKHGMSPGADWKDRKDFLYCALSRRTLQALHS